MNMFYFWRVKTQAGTGTILEYVAFNVIDPFDFDANSGYELPYILIERDRQS